MNFPQTAFEKIVEYYRPTYAINISIEGWFGNKWLGFSGKILGSLGISKLRLTVPPFVPNRVLSEVHYEYNDQRLFPIITEQKLHGYRTSQQNQNIYLDTFWKDAVLFWHGSPLDRIPIMVYRICPEGNFAWFASVLEDNRIDFIQGISKLEAETILKLNTAQQDAAANP